MSQGKGRQNTLIDLPVLLRMGDAVDGEPQASPLALKAPAAVKSSPGKASSDGGAICQ